MSNHIGIDFGTNHVRAVAYFDGDYRLLPIDPSDQTATTDLTVLEDGEVVFSWLAWRVGLTAPERHIASVMRLLGRRFDSPEVQRFRARHACRVVPGENGDAWVEVHGRQYAPQELVGLVLRQIKTAATKHLGHSAIEATLAVPSSFNELQRRALADAAHIAGLQVWRLVNAPTAAALVQHVHPTVRGMKTTRAAETVAIYSLGGGVCDVSIVDLAATGIEVLGSSGDSELGGGDFDARVVDWLAQRFARKSGVDLRTDRKAFARLREGTELARVKLSRKKRSELEIPFIAADTTGPKHLSLTVARSALEGKVEDLVQKTIALCRNAVEQARVSLGEINRVILVGGLTQMPRIRQAVAEFFEKEPCAPEHGEACVAMGAMLFGSATRRQSDAVICMELASHSLALESADGRVSPLIPRGTGLPAKKQLLLAADQRPVLVQGTQRIGHLEFGDAPTEGRDHPLVPVDLELDVSGLIQTSAPGGRNVRFVRQSGLTDADAERMRVEAELYEAATRKKRALADLRLHADGLVYVTEQALDEHGDLLPAVEKKEITRDLHALKEAMKGTDDAVIKAAVQRLEESAYRGWSGED